jgi:dihydroorotate dehydrogenase (NAD+) catalytic subunit
MLKSNTPFYDPLKTYDENYEKGPYGAFAEDEVYMEKGDSQYEYYGHRVYLPFGIPAGPLINSKYVKAAFDKGFDIAVYKTVRSDFYQTHPFPNILSVHVDGELTLQKLQKPLISDTNFQPPIAITNSFNIPSKKPEEWQADMQKALSYARKGQVMVGSFVGTVRENQTRGEFISDWATVAKMVKETGAPILEADISCPNNGVEGLVCYDIETTRKICESVRKVIGNTPFVLKVGYYEDQVQLNKFAEIANEYADGISAINTLPGIIVDRDGNQALPGKNRTKGGVCGAPIKWAGLEMVKKLKKIREDKGYKFKIDGVGGVATPEDYDEYIRAGADSVFSATGALWNPYMAQEIKTKYKK